MKKLLLFIILLLCPFVTVYAEDLYDISYNDANIVYTIDYDEWSEKELNEDRDYIDRKYVSDCGVIMTGSYDLYSEFTAEELEGVSREYFNYKNLFTSNEFNQSLIDEWNQTYNINNWKITNGSVKYLYLNGSMIQNGISIDFDMYMTINNGYALIIQYMKSSEEGTPLSGTCSYSIDQLINSSKPIGKVKKEGSVMDGNAVLYLILDLVLTIIIFMGYPWYVVTQQRRHYTEKKFNSMLKWNSVIAGIITLVIIAMENAEAGAWSAAPCVFYYYINKSVFGNKAINLNKKKKKNDTVIEKTEEEFKCNNCGAIVKESDKYCKNCNAIFEEEDNLETDEETFTCDNCGAIVKESDTKCPGCGLIFEENETDEEEFKCDNCGAIVKASATGCPNCGEEFVEDDEDIEENIKESKISNTSIDTKYEELKKIKELLDDGILTKEEFEKEKKKILKK